MKGMFAFASVALLAGAAMAGGTAVRYVDEFDLSGSTAGFGKHASARVNADGKPLVIAGRRFERGFGTQPEGGILFRTDGGVKCFEATVGLDDAAKDVGKRHSYGPAAATFRVWVDGKVAWSSGDMRVGNDPKSVKVNLAGAKEIILETTSGKTFTEYPRALSDWGDARFTCDGDARLEAVNDPSLTVQLGMLTPPEKAEPQINGADIWGVRPGHPVLFRVATTGMRPMKFSASGLPAGVILDGKGVLRGTAPEKAGSYDIEVTAENAKGRATRTIRLEVGDMLALTPPMGWNAWNTLCYRVTDEKVRAAALAMEKSGLGDHGWSYINIDDWWQMNTSRCGRVTSRRNDLGREDVIGAPRDANGKIVPNRAFPDMKALTDYIHGFGFKAGLYSSPGPLTCGECEGSYGHEMQDAESWAEWGFDYLKYDWCTYTRVLERETGRKLEDWRDPTMREHLAKPYRLMGECLRRQKRDILYSFCQYGLGYVETWGAQAGGHCWRSFEDLKDNWVWLEKAIEGRINGRYWDYNRPGWWADPDMMIVGQQLSYGYDHSTFLTPNEQYTHVSLWAMIGAPMLIGCDLPSMDAFTRSLLANDAVIAVHQDRLGKTARRIRHTDAESVWARPLSGGSTAVALVNRAPFAREVRVDFAELGVPNRNWVKDLWRQKCEGKHGDYYCAKVPPHATKLVKLRPVECSKCD